MPTSAMLATMSTMPITRPARATAGHAGVLLARKDGQRDGHDARKNWLRSQLT